MYSFLEEDDIPQLFQLYLHTSSIITKKEKENTISHQIVDNYIDSISQLSMTSSPIIQKSYYILFKNYKRK